MPAPRRIEAVLWLLLPPACREYVLGDLCEKCSSTQEYLREAILVLPLVIISRIRRTTDTQLLLMEAVSLYLSFSVAAWYLGQRAFLYAQFGFARLTIPTGVAVTGLLFCSAWSDPQRRSFIKPILQAAGSIAFALLGQAVIFDTSSYLAVPLQILLCGSVLAFLLISTLRVLFQPSGIGPAKVLPISIEENTRRSLGQEPGQYTIRPVTKHASAWLPVVALAALLAAFLAYWVKLR
ncbi:MAG TPA: hypothetical protein VHZ55_01415 [Bryobacteraceae bacterium]|nr:hypothetical protein [Bryobacteraceae bacterium]